MIKKLNFSEAHDMMTRRDVVLLDVREEPEYITGHAIDAELLPVDEITADTAADLIPSKDTPVMVYCRTGRRSERAASILEDLGYREIYDMGGLVGWPYGLV
jgi:rhodanese-related sulfurtransferase